jgi:DNA mismatch endonuclease (patch repair protein)
MRRSDPDLRRKEGSGCASMVDVFSKSKRSKIMAAIRSVHTKPEIVLRAFLRRSGFRIHLHVASLPGTPDITVPRYRTAIFVNGCFWHGHRGCKRAALPATRTAFWRAKIAGNLRRDRRNNAALRRLGWHVVTVWQCQLTPQKVEGRFRSLLTRLRELSESSRPHVP